MNSSESKKPVSVSKPPQLWRRLFLGKNPRWMLVRLLGLALIIVVTFKFCLQPIQITGSSMEPTFHDGQNKFINKLAYARQAPRRGDVVVFHSVDPKEVFVKRIIGLPGERIAFHSGIVFINGKPLEEPYVLHRNAFEWPDEILGTNVYFVAGDNRSISQQFRLERTRILGKLL